MGNVTTLILVRHGQTNSNVKGLLHGQTDVPLTERGIAQARLVATRLARGGDIAAVYTSPLERARHTAEIIGEALGREAVPHPGLMEINFGLAEGLTLVEANERHPELELEKYRDDPERELHWPEGESRAAFRARVGETLRALLDVHRGETIVAVAHGGVISVGLGDLLHEPDAGWRRYMVANCAITQLEWHGPDRPVAILCLDDRDHLAELPPADTVGVYERGDRDE